MPAIQVGASGTLTFMPNLAGIEAVQIAGVTWVAQSGSQYVTFTAPDKVSGIAPGKANYKCTVTMTTPGEKTVYNFDVDCIPVTPVSVVPKVIPITITPEGATG